MLLKPAQLVIKRKGDPEQLAKDWQEYVKVFQEFLQATEVAGNHANPETPNDPCTACVKVKNMLSTSAPFYSSPCRTCALVNPML